MNNIITNLSQTMITKITNNAMDNLNMIKEKNLEKQAIDNFIKEKILDEIIDNIVINDEKNNQVIKKDIQPINTNLFQEKIKKIQDTYGLSIIKEEVSLPVDDLSPVNNHHIEVVTDVPGVYNETLKSNQPVSPLSSYVSANSAKKSVNSLESYEDSSKKIKTLFIMSENWNFSKLHLGQEYRLLSKYEKQHIMEFFAQTNNSIKKISKNDWYAKITNASSGDVICLIDYQTSYKRYRLVE